MKATTYFLRARCLFTTQRRLLSTNFDPAINQPLYEKLQVPQQNTETQPLNEDITTKDLSGQRELFEDSLKFAASQLSNKTVASDLVQMLRTSAYLENNLLSSKLAEYLKSKASQVTNEELGWVFSALVLMDAKSVDQKFVRLLEYLTMRRVHGLTAKELTSIFCSYAYLCRQHKAPVNSSFVKTFEYIIVNKLHELNQDQLAQNYLALIRIQKISQTKTKIVSNQTLLQLFDKFSYELEDNKNGVKVQNIAEVYYASKKHSVLSKEIDTLAIHERLKHQLASEKLHAKDLFNILEVVKTDEIESKPLVALLIDQTKQIIPTMIPEELVILNSLASKNSIQGEFVHQIEAYVNEQMEEMQIVEIAKVYQSCIKNQVPLTPQFKALLDEKMIQILIVGKSDAKTLPYILPLIPDSSLKPDQQLLRDQILKVLRQKDFSASTYILTLVHMLNNTADLKQDLEFWRQFLQYVPLLELENISQYCSLRSCIQNLSDNVKELDFTNLLLYLEDTYEKPYIMQLEQQKTKTQEVVKQISDDQLK